MQPTKATHGREQREKDRYDDYVPKFWRMSCSACLSSGALSWNRDDAVDEATEHRRWHDEDDPEFVTVDGYTPSELEESGIMDSR